MAKRPGGVPKFGTWDSENVGYTVYFDKVRENKSATAPPLHLPRNHADPEDNPRMTARPSRPATSSGHGEPPHRRAPSGHPHQHRRAGSNASDPGGRAAEQSKFAPPPQYLPRPSPQHQHHHHPPPPAGYGGGGGGGHRAPAQGAPRQHQQVAPPGPRARSASPQNNAPNRQKPMAGGAVPRFGVWDEQSAGSALGFTVQFENVKRHREVARGAAPDVPRSPSPVSAAAARSSHDDSFLSKMFGCFTTRR